MLVYDVQRNRNIGEPVNAEIVSKELVLLRCFVVVFVVVGFISGVALRVAGFGFAKSTRIHWLANRATNLTLQGPIGPPGDHVCVCVCDTCIYIYISYKYQP